MITLNVIFPLNGLRLSHPNTSYYSASYTPAYQRILISSDNITNIRKNFIISTMVLIILNALVALIPLFLYLTNKGLNYNCLVEHILNKFTDIGTRNILIIGIMGMAMSTADSYTKSTIEISYFL